MDTDGLTSIYQVLDITANDKCHSSDSSATEESVPILAPMVVKPPRPRPGETPENPQP
jgi:hypothetical protein